MTVAATLIAPKAVEHFCPQVSEYNTCQQTNKNSQGDQCYLKVCEDTVGILNFDEILHHDHPVLSAFHCFRGLTGIKASIRGGGSDDETLAE